MEARLPIVLQGAMGAAVLDCSSVEVLAILGQVSGQLASFRNMYKARNFNSRLAELIGRRAHVIGSTECQAAARRRKAVFFVIMWLSIVLVVIPCTIAISAFFHQPESQDMASPPAAVMWMAVACTAVAVVVPRWFNEWLLPKHGMMQPYEMPALVVSPQHAHIFRKPQVEKEWKVQHCLCSRGSLYYSLFRCNNILNAISLLLAPYVVITKNIAARGIFVVAVPLVQLLSFLVMIFCFHWPEISPDKISKYPCVHRCIVKAFHFLLQFEELAMIWFVPVVISGGALNCLVDGSPLHFFQMASIFSAMPVLTASSLMRPEIMIFNMIAVSFYCLFELFAAGTIKLTGSDRQLVCEDCSAGPFWLCANAVVGLLLFAWVCTAQKPSLVGAAGRLAEVPGRLRALSLRRKPRGSCEQATGEIIGKTDGLSEAVSSAVAERVPAPSSQEEASASDDEQELWETV
eukprot:TRINITY_DN16604_c0_g1_i1.p1 TRINITY_DN16604_c0_g1~~TRINITY_DN16604_c0_g1_i1.p1  ORF type:complete len:461 (+),score=77.45 TRINITY_DN16604_c0_g1_i1:45-1427(+)